MTQNERYNDVWQDCIDRLRGAITEEEIVKWFKPIRPINFDGANLSLRVPNESFVAKAPAQVIEGERAKLAKYLETRASLAEALAKLG